MIKLKERLWQTAGPPPKLRIHPHSVLFRTKPECVLFHQLVPSAHSAHHDMTDLLAIPLDWLPAIAPHMFRHVSAHAQPSS